MKILKHGNDHETTINAVFRCFNCDCEEGVFDCMHIWESDYDDPT